jgi:hypothetical protein
MGAVVSTHEVLLGRLQLVELQLEQALFCLEAEDVKAATMVTRIAADGIKRVLEQVDPPEES